MRDSTTWSSFIPCRCACWSIPLSKPTLPLTAECNTKEYSGQRVKL
jgi:hypothetical protein